MSAEHVIGMTVLPPYMTDPSWVTVAEAATRLQRSVRTIERWCRDGTLIEFGFPIFKDGKGRWWVRFNKA